MSRDIRISEKHGLNPSLMQCRLCGADTGVALVGRLPGDAEAPRHIPGAEPCAKCRDMMSQGILLVEATQNAAGTCLTGRLWVATEDDARRMLTGPEGERAIAGRAAYIEPEACKRLGLPYTE